MALRPVSQKLFAACAVLVLGLGAAALATRRHGPTDEGATSRDALRSPLRDAMRGGARADALAASRAVLGRPWFDRLPRSARDDVEEWIFLAGGLGAQFKGSTVRYGVDLFDFERQNDRLAIVFLQDEAKANVRFEVKACDEPPFDACLVFAEPLRGRTKLYSWLDDEDLAAHLPWLRGWRSQAEAQIEAARRARD